MALASKSSRRVWKAPLTKAWWAWLAATLLLYACIYAIYLIAVKTQPFPGPFNDPFRSFGILAFVLVLATATYSLRRRFVRAIPGRPRTKRRRSEYVAVASTRTKAMRRKLRNEALNSPGKARAL